jgi:hypothetical protein
VDGYDREAEARALAESVQIALAQTAIVEVGAIGLGALMVKLLATTLADVSGVLAAGAVAVMGLYVLPNRRRRAKNELAARISDLRQRLGETLTTQFETELGQSVQRIREAMRPYTRFVETQGAVLSETEAALRAAQSSLRDLAEQVGAN